MHDGVRPTTPAGTNRAPGADAPWLTRGVAGIGTASFLADVEHEIPTALLPSLLTSTLGAPAAALGLIEGVSDALAGAAKFGGGALADDPARRRGVAVGGYTLTAALAALTGAAGSVWQVGFLRAGAWTARGLRVPACNALLADLVPASAYGRAYGFERAMDNLGAIGGPLLALALVAAFSVRTRHPALGHPRTARRRRHHLRHPRRPRLEPRPRQPIRLRLRPVLTGGLGRLMLGIGAFEAGNVAATVASIPAGRLGDRLGPRGPVRILTAGVALFALAYAGFAAGGTTVLALAPASSSPASRSAA